MNLTLKTKIQMSKFENINHLIMKQFPTYNDGYSFRNEKINTKKPTF